MTQYIKRLPAVFQTTTEKKFFDATFDQVFSKKDSDLVYGYIGRRDPGYYNPIKDFYLPEPDKNRTWWQLEATAFARDENQNKTNIFFYEDMLNKVSYYGGNTLNQDRLFESQYYSWGPPIDYDMFVNYQNYYWIEQGLPAIEITGVLAVDIIGQPSFTVTLPGTPAGLTLTTGLKIILVDDPTPGPYTVENVGYQNCADGGIRLVPQYSDYTSGTLFEFLPWDNSKTLATGRVIHNEFWDQNTWDTEARPGGGDYITIERGSISQNAWSRTNKWFHIDAINTAVAYTNSPFPSNATRAFRPIIQFVADLELYDSGSVFKTEIQYGINDDQLGNPYLLSQVQGQTKAYIETLYDISLSGNDLFVFFSDPANKQIVYRASIDFFEVVTFIQEGTPVIDGDIVFSTKDSPYDGAQRGETWFYKSGVWQQAFNDKVSSNQPPLFQLYDHNGIPLNDTTFYPESNFQGNKIFSYKVNTSPGATVDPVLGFPIVYTSLNQSSDIVFQNNVYIDRYAYSAAKVAIDGYYYYKTCDNVVLYNNWNLYAPTAPTSGSCSTWPVTETSRQRVIDKYVVGYGTEFQFKLSVSPWGYPACPDIIVSVNGTEVQNSTLQPNGYTFVQINNDIYVDLTAYLVSLLSTTQKVAPVVELQTYTRGLLNPSATGYFEIPQQLEANPTQQEVTEISASNLNQQFSSIIANQVGFTGVSFGGDNNYRDSLKNRSVGQYILQNIAPTLKSMLVSSSDDLDFIPAVRFSSDEYTKFKNKYTTTALQLINQGFNPAQYYNNTINISAWVNQILNTVSLSKEFSNAFAYSYMLASGSPSATETHAVPAGPTTVTLTNFIDLEDPKNTLYVYNADTQDTLLTIGIDYVITSTNLAIDVALDLAAPANITFALYKNPPPNYIPSTPSKVGTYEVYVPRIEWDFSYVQPTQVIVGHDGSRTVAYGDYRDDLLLELETRIYNKLQAKYRDQYGPPLRLESVKSGYFRHTRYSREEYLDITESYLNKWSAKNRANYRTNDWATFSATAPVAQLWKLYNYTQAIVGLTPPGSQPYILPGNWKGIFQYYYDTYTPDITPWEMLGFTEKPDWWELEYGAPVVNTNGQLAWTSTAAGLNNMWIDLEAGYIRRGPRAAYNPVDNSIVANYNWARPGLSNIIPVDAGGNIIDVVTLFNVTTTGNPYEPFDGFDADWVYGDGSPVEQAWMSTSTYAFSVQEFLYLMRPGPFGELLWDTIGTERSPGSFIHPTAGIVNSTINWQYVQNDSYTSSDSSFKWQRPKNQDQYVHAETVNGEIILRFGYQRWISDRILFLNKDVTSTFGQKVRTLDVNLANQLAGFTNKDTTNTYIESVSPGASSTNLLIPTNNFSVILHESQPIATYSYSGIVVRALVDGTFAVYGYDLLNSQFTVLDRSDQQSIDITVGGTPAPFVTFESGATYNAGDIVRYNGVYYESTATQVLNSFKATNFIKLKTLPMIGGVSVSYKPYSLTTTTRVPYGSILKTAQEVFDLMIGWGAWLETQGWQFEEVDPQTNQISNWLASAKQFLFWLNSQWAPDASIQLSPLANSATLIVANGYPLDVETITNGVYNILDKFGVAISPDNTTTEREGKIITVAPSDLSSGGIYFLSISASNTEHILIFDNTTSFNDVIYDPLLRTRQQRLRFNGFRSNAWYGKKEAPGYLIIENQLVPNFDTIVDSMRYYYDPNVTIDNPSIEDLGRHLIGYESKSYLDNLLVSNDVQYLFYQGAIRQKGTKQAFEKLFRSTKVQRDEIIEVFEEWALKLSNFGNTIEQVSTEFILLPERTTGEVIVARLNYVPSDVGHVREIRILNAQDVYETVPVITIDAPDSTPFGVDWPTFSDIEVYAVGSIVRYDDEHGNPVYYSSNIAQGPGPFNPANWTVELATKYAKAYAVLNSGGVISRVDLTDPGTGYLSAPGVQIVSSSPSNDDRLYSVWQGDIIRDTISDNIVDIDIDDVAVWTRRPPDPQHSLQFPTTNDIYYSMPNAGYVNFNDVDFSRYNVFEAAVTWGSNSFNPMANDTIWFAKTFTEDWDVFKLIDVTIASGFEVVQDPSGFLFMKTLQPYLVVPQLSTTAGESTDFGNQVVMQVVEAKAVAEVDNGKKGATAEAVVPIAPVVTSFISSGKVTGITISSGTGSGYTFTPQVDIQSPPIEVATATSTLSGGGINSILVVTGGANYTSVPTILIQGDGNGATAHAVLTGGVVTSIVVDTAGAGYTFAQVSVSPPTNVTAQAIAVVTDGVLTDIVVTTSGTGYTSAPIVTVEPPAGAGSVFEIQVTDGGAGYDPLPSLPPVITISGTGTGASATANIEDGKVKSVIVNTGGIGFTSVPTVTIAPPAGAGSVTGITVTKTGANYTSPPNVTITGAGTGATAVAKIAGGVVSEIVITNPGTGYVSTTTNVVIDPPVKIGGATNYTLGFTYNSVQTASADDGYNWYDLVTLTGDSITASDISQFSNFTNLMLYKTLRFRTTPTVPSYVSTGDYIWVDNPTALWTVYNVGNPTSTLTIHRQQAPLINTKLFESAEVFDTKSQNELVLLPVYDPFKDILPGPAKQNITYMSYRDPARYNVTGDNRLFSQNITFAQQQVGQLWWDLSNVRYVYYEQPVAVDGTETSYENLVYRRDRWGQIFPGSSVDIYEWVESVVPPSEYTGSGTPRDVTSYVQIVTFNRFTNISQTYYYFWVIGKTTKPNRENRTLAATDVARLLQSPKTQNFAFFSPIQQTETNNSYMFYNVQEILVYRGDNIQIKYRIGLRDDQPHAQWMFFREGDPASVVTDQYWNKMVDSLCGYTKVLPASAEWSNGIFIASDLPWDIYGWDVAQFDSATSTTTPVYGEILAVPDPTLSEAEKYGITYRPRQGMFVDIYNARKIFTQSGNELLKHIPIRDDNPSWNSGVTSSTYWSYQTWYALGYENVQPVVSFITLSAAQSELVLGNLKVGDIVEVVDGTPDGRFVLYAVVQVDPNVNVLSFEKVAVQNSAILLLDTMYTTKNSYGLSVELRQLLNAFRTQVFINNYIVDQNELFFSMLNFVMSEQKNPIWLFKSSYIYIKENNLPLSQDALYIPDQIDNIISYIDDVKPYHTQIRDYTSTYQTTDIAPGTASDSYKINMTLTFGPTDMVPPVSHLINGQTLPNGYVINAETFQDVIDQFVSQEEVYTVDITAGDFDTGKIGYSTLFPYTVSFDSINLNNPQNIITPVNIVGVQIGTTVLFYGKDYFVENLSGTDYTIFFFENPYGPVINPTNIVPKALVWIDAGGFQSITFDTYRNELGLGFSTDDMVINVDTKLPVNDATGTLTPYSGWGDVWDVIEGPIADALVQAGGQPEIPWDSPLNAVLLDNKISFKENATKDGHTYYRNSYENSGVLVNDILAPGVPPVGEPEWLDVITVFVDPLTHVNTNVLPEPTHVNPGVIWIGGERIEYKDKTFMGNNTWELRLVRRGTQGTAPQPHTAGTIVFVEAHQDLPGSPNSEAWNTDTLGTDAVPLGGLWYARTPEAVFLTQEQGKAIP